MTSVKRWDYYMNVGGMSSDPDGRYVLASDYDALESFCEGLKGVNDQQRGHLARLQHIIDCSDTPLMADVMRERDEWKDAAEDYLNVTTKLQAAEARIIEARKAIQEAWYVLDDKELMIEDYEGMVSAARKACHDFLFPLRGDEGGKG